MVDHARQSEPSFLELALRAWTTPLSARPSSRSWTQSVESWLPKHVLVFDTETTVDETQTLNFGSWRYYRLNNTDPSNREMVCVDEGLFFGEDVRDRYPQGYETLREYRASRLPDVDPSQADSGVELQLLSQREFVDEILINAAFELRAWIVGFNLPFDLSRVAYGSGYARKSPNADRDRFEGGFSFPMAMYLNDEGQLVERRLYRPRVAVKTIDSKRHLIGLRSPAEIDEVHRLPDPKPEGNANDDTHVPAGNFLDLRTLAFALTDKSYSLERACEDFNVEHPKLKTAAHGAITSDYIDYNRRDVKATGELFAQLMDEYLKHSVSVSPTFIYSPASIGRAYLDRMGIRPVLDTNPDFPEEVLGYAMAAYYGGRAECRIRRVELPVVYCDFLSMYPTVNTLMRLWDHLTADHVGVEEATDELRAFLDDVTLDDCFRPETWQRLPALVLIQPAGDILPARAGYDEMRHSSHQIGVNPVTSTKPLWYTLADAIASKLLTGKTPDVVRGLKLTHGAKAVGLRPHKLRGQQLVDPTTQDLFQTIIETRKSLPADTEDEFLDTALKVLANATSYGIFAQIDRRELGGDRTEPAQVYGLDGPFSKPNEMTAVETPGKYSFPPIAACITGAARLMLALAERLVTDAGGSYVFCDTDSIAIVSTQDGSILPCPGGTWQATDGGSAVKALSWDEVDRIRARFDELHPYNRDRVPGSILELEKQNYIDNSPNLERQQLYCYAISAKRYALYNRTTDGDVTVRKASQHGLGHLLNPTDPASEDRNWINQVWEHIIRTETGATADPPGWFHLPAIGQLSVSTPVLHRPFDKRNKTDGGWKPYWEQVKPFNFMLTAQTDAIWKRPTDAEDIHRFHLISPWNPDPNTWLDLEWIDRYSSTRKTYRATTKGTTGEKGLAIVSTYGSTVNNYRTQPETKSLDPVTLRPARGRDHGVLRRRPVSIAADAIKYIGKESNQLEEVEAGIHHAFEEVVSEYTDPGADDWVDIYRPALQLLKEEGRVSDTSVAKTLGVNRSTPYRWRTGQAAPTSKQMADLEGLIARLLPKLPDSERVRDHRTRIVVWLEQHL